MKVESVREMSPEERERKLLDLKEELFNLRFQHGAGQLENSQKLKQTKRDIARVKTVIREATQTTKDN
jgi:large subunit ribosomal protein L29